MHAVLCHSHANKAYTHAHAHRVWKHFFLYKDPKLLMKHLPTSAVVSWDSVSGSVCAKLEYILLSVSVFAVPQRTSLSTHTLGVKLTKCPEDLESLVWSPAERLRPLEDCSDPVSFLDFTDFKTLSFSAVSRKTSNRSFLCESIS